MRLRMGLDDAGVGAVVIEDAFFVLYVVVGFTVLMWLSYGTLKLIKWIIGESEEKCRKTNQ